MTNKHRTTFYVGVTSDLVERVGRHKSGKGSAFTSRYRLYDLVYFEEFPTIAEAIKRENQLKIGIGNGK
jgi:putative endonuclease